MPNTRPGIFFDDEGVCIACRNYEKQASTDWDKGKKELDKLSKELYNSVSSFMRSI